MKKKTVYDYIMPERHKNYYEESCFHFNIENLLYVESCCFYCKDFGLKQYEIAKN